jgi:hypothetical protein
MSTSTALIVVPATAISSTFLFMYITQAANIWYTKLAIGVIDGVPITTKFRRLLLTQIWVAYVGGAVATGVMLSFINIQFARHIDDSGVKTVCYAIAVVGGYLSVDWVVKGAIWWFHARDVLREAEAD